MGALPYISDCRVEEEGPSINMNLHFSKKSGYKVFSNFCHKKKKKNFKGEFLMVATT